MYWSFIGLSGIFILPSTFFLLKTMFQKECSDNLNQDLEIALLKTQLAQINRDIKSGVSDKNDELNKITISRKILEFHQTVAKKTVLSRAPTKPTVWVSSLIVIICLAGTHLTYLLTNDNFFSSGTFVAIEDKEFNSTQPPPSQEAIEKKLALRKNLSNRNQIDLKSDSLKKLVNDLKKFLASHPAELRGQKLLVKNSARLGDFVTARKAQRKVLELLNSDAKSSDYSNYAELCVLAASGYVSPAAADAIDKAIALDAQNNQANFYLSLFFLQENKTSYALKNWIKLIKNDPSSKWISMLAEQSNQLSSNLSIELVNNKTTPNYLIKLKAVFMEVLKVLEQHLDNHGGTAKDWTALIKSYRNLKAEDKVEILIRKVKSLFLLSDNQIKELEMGEK